MSTKYCLIGDLHGRMDTLNKIFEKSPGYHFVFMGDVIHHKAFFKRTKKSSPIKMLLKIKELMDKGKASMVLGNNEFYILKNLVLPEEEIKQREVKHSLEKLRELDLDKRLSLLTWLSNLPLTLQLEQDNQLIRIAHAYYLDLPQNQLQNHRSKIIFGPGYPWFKTDKLSDHIEVDRNILYFFGHYGYPYFRKNLKIIDATNFEGIGVYYSDREEFLIYY